LVNASALTLFLAAAAGRRRPKKPLPLWGVVAESVGFGLLSLGGWLGGTLVYRNQIGVDHRYAGAGKWKEISVSGAPGEMVAVAREDELQTNQMKLVRVNGERLVVARAEAGWTVFDDRCTHKGGSLAGGVMAAGTVTCPWHGSQFDAATGAVKCGPAQEPIRSHQVQVVAGEVRLRVPATARIPESTGAEESRTSSGGGSPLL
jgi:nitrite reductase/ring-hydroxylating ferredoxin subunit